MRIIATSTLKAFYERPAGAAAEQPVKTFVALVRKAEWTNPVEIKATFNSADLLPDGRVVFDLGGNKYRVVAKINFKHRIVYIRFVGTHREYDQINARTV